MEEQYKIYKQGNYIVFWFSNCLYTESNINEINEFIKKFKKYKDKKYIFINHSSFFTENKKAKRIVKKLFKLYDKHDYTLARLNKEV